MLFDLSVGRVARLVAVHSEMGFISSMSIYAK